MPIGSKCPWGEAGGGGDMTRKVVDVSKLFDRSCDALCILIKYNRLHNDLDAYLHEVAQWGLGRSSTQPTLEAYGLDGEEGV